MRQEKAAAAAATASSHDVLPIAAVGRLQGHYVAIISSFCWRRRSGAVRPLTTSHGPDRLCWSRQHASRLRCQIQRTTNSTPRSLLIRYALTKSVTQSGKPSAPAPVATRLQFPTSTNETFFPAKHCKLIGIIGIIQLH